jgi:thioredoxin 2
MSATTIVTCPHCGKKNRIASRPEGLPRCAVCHHALPWIVDADAATFDEELRSSLPVLVDFWAPWCGPCRMVTPAVEHLAGEFAGRLKVVKLNTDGAPQIAARYNIQGIPLLVLHRDGQEVDRKVGALPEPALRQWLEPQLGPPVGEPTARS